MNALDPDRCYAALQSRDARFDGVFVTAVKTTGIYCRPSCPAITPRRANVEFYPAAASAQQRGFRACKRCRPDAAPGSPEWNVRRDVVARAMRLIGDGVVERDGVRGLARRLGYSERHLNRLMTDELGAGPLAVARAQRAHTARTLIETTDMTLTDVAFAAGFGSVRQFNDTIREVFASAPTELRARRRSSSASCRSDMVVLRLPVRAPFDGAGALAFVGGRAIEGMEQWDGRTYRRTVRLEGGCGVVELRAAADHVVARVRLEEWSDLGSAVHRIRRLLDLDADPVAVDAALARHEELRPLVHERPGMRSPSTVDPFEVAVRAVVGQQVSVAGAVTVTGRIVAQVATETALDQTLPLLFPTPEELIEADVASWSMPARRARTILALAEALASGRVVLDEGSDPDEARARLLELDGIGPWTADYIVLRALGDPDVLLTTDLAVRHGAERVGLDLTRHERFAPWRSYVTHHLWAATTAPTERTTPDEP